MPFWPATDYTRIITLLELVAANISAPSTGYDRLYDPGTVFTPPAPTGDPENPAMWAEWGFASHDPVPTQDKDTAGSRTIAITFAIWTERAAGGGSVQTGLARLLAAEFFRELQDQSVANLTVIPQTMRWAEPPGRVDPNWDEAQMRIEFHSK
jgi:hypothetical protein